MKYINRLAFLAALFLLASTANAQVRSADSIVHKLFSSLKNKDEKAFTSLYPNSRQMASMVRGMMEAMFNSDEMKKMMAMDEKSKNLNIDSLINAQVAQMDKPETQAEMQKSFSENFQQIIDKGEKKGVNWSQAQLVSYTLDSTARVDDEEMKMFAGSGMKNLKGVIDFRAGGTDYQMNFDKVLFIPSEGGWFGGEFKQVIKKGENFSADAGADVPPTDESTAERDARLKKETKTKVKTDGDKTKSKTKTPAGKTKTKTKSKA
jgi:hypothetical protein